MKNKLIKIFSLLVLCLFLQLPASDAQCPMCRMSAEKNLAAGGTAGKGLNKGILYMLLTPYLIVGGIAYVWWRNRKKDEDLELEELVDSININ